MIFTLSIFMQIDPKSYCKPTTNNTFSKKATKHTELGHLKVVKLEGFVNQEDEFNLLKRIRELVTVEPLIISALDENCGNLLTSTPSPKHAQMCL